MKTIRIETNGQYKPLFLCSDIHIDSADHLPDLFLKHLNFCLKKNIDIVINGDIFDLMQSRYDGRRKNQQEKKHYFNDVLKDTVKTLEPYSHLIKAIFKGNHETSVERHSDLNMLELLIDLLNAKGSNIEIGGYQNILQIGLSHTTSKYNYNIFAHHGVGGNAPVTKGIISFNRISNYLDGVDAVWQGHSHDIMHQEHTKLLIGRDGNPKKITNHWLRTPSYKDEFMKGEGWAVEKGFAPLTEGGLLLELFYDKNKGVKTNTTHWDNFIWQELRESNEGIL